MNAEPDPVSDERQRIRRRARVRLRQLEKRIDAEPANDSVWQAYVEAGRLYLEADRTGADALITTEQLARKLHVSPETIRERVKQGRLAPAASFGRRGGYRFPPEARPS